MVGVKSQRCPVTLPVWNGHEEKVEFQIGEQGDVNPKNVARRVQVTGRWAVQSSGKSISEMERELGITPGLLAKWKSRLKTEGAHADRKSTRLNSNHSQI